MFLSGLLVFIVSLYAAVAVAHGSDPAHAAAQPYTLTQVFKGAMSDPVLNGYELLATRLDIIPGGIDPAPHRHDADTFVYVLQGEVEIELEGQKATYGAGTMFHEPRNALHSLLRNTSAQQPASVLAIFVIKTGREFFVPEDK